MKIKILILTIIFGYKCWGNENLEEIVSSPDGNYFAQYVDGSVTISKKNLILKKCPTSSLEYPLKWTKDSKALILIKHLAHGTFAKVIFPEKSDCFGYDIDPPVEDAQHVQGYSVVDMKIGVSLISFVYKVGMRYSYRGDDEFFTYKFDYDLDKNKISNLIKKKISSEEYISLTLKDSKITNPR